MGTAADRELVHLLRNYPCPEPIDRARAVFAMHPARTQANLALQMHGRPLLVSEVGSTAPNAYTHCFRDGSCLVVLNTGIVDFLGAVSAALFGNTTLYVGNAPSVAPALTPEDAASRLAALYAAWRSGALWREERLRAEPVGLTPEGAGFADMLAGAASLFILSHELGHAVLHTAALSGSAATEALTPAQELEADAFGTKLAVLGWGDEGRKNWRWAAAGAMVALRTLSALARLGHVFPGAHPPPGTRLAQLRSVLHGMCGSDEAYYHVTTVAVGFEEQMEAAEQILLGHGRSTQMSVERAVSGLCAILEAAEKGTIPEVRALADATSRLDGADRDMLVAAGTVAGRILAPRSPWYGQSPQRREMVALLGRMLPDLPAAFREGYTAEQS